MYTDNLKFQKYLQFKKYLIIFLKKFYLLTKSRLFSAFEVSNI